MAKRKRSSVLETKTIVPSPAVVPHDVAALASSMMPPIPSRRASTRKGPPRATAAPDPNPDTNLDIQDGIQASRASPDAVAISTPGKAVRGKGRKVTAPVTPNPGVKKEEPDDIFNTEPADAEVANDSIKKTPGASKKASITQPKLEDADDPEADGTDDADPEELTQALLRPPPVNSSFLPLPWKGRLGYACLNTYLRYSNPPVFSSRTCRIASILEHRHPLKDPTQPEHSTKNRPNKDAPPDIARGQAWVEALGLANARDIAKMLRWNDRYGIKFLRLSSEMFPFASHDLYGYKLAPFASEALAEAGRVAAQLGHRLTTHPGQFTQLGSPRQEVITASFRDLEYHCELLDLLKLPPQQDRDAVMILHMGGVFGDKSATLQRFKENYQKLSPGVKKRLVLENDDVCYTVHDLLPICEELNIPLVLDFHHHNILFDADKIREGTLDIMGLYDRIKATWDRKNITQKMHYSEPTAAAITPRQRRKHSPRVMTLPPCSPNMDLMIEAKDKEQAVFELMRTFKLPGYDTFNDIKPHLRDDENKPWKPPKKTTPKKKKPTEAPDDAEEEELQPPPLIPSHEIGMGGPSGRVYWPPGMEEWLRPKKKEVKARDPQKAKSTAERAAEKRAEKAAWQAEREASAERDQNGSAASASASEMVVAETPKLDLTKTKSVYEKPKVLKAAKSVRSSKSSSKTQKSAAMTPSTSDHEEDEEEDEMDVDMPDLTDAEEATTVILAKRTKKAPQPISRAVSNRSTKRKAVNYAEGEEED